MNWKYRIRKAEQGSALNWEIYFPPGLSTWASEHINSLLNEIKLPKQPEFKLRTFTEKLKLENATAHQIAYLFDYCHFIRDIRLVICKTDDWQDSNVAIEAEMQKVVESALPIAKTLIAKGKHINQNTLLSSLHGSYFEKDITVTLSIFGESAYIRGVKAAFPTSAPVPEDLAHALLIYTREFAHWDVDMETAFYLPFAGTGTFGTEWEILEMNLPTHRLPRKAIFSTLTIYPENTIGHYAKQKMATTPRRNTTQLWLDTDPALASYWSKERNSWEPVLGKKTNWRMKTENFLNIDDPMTLIDIKEVRNTDFGIFLPLNPPYGFRKKEIHTHDDSLYKDIGKQLENIANVMQNKYQNTLKQFAGFLLCPTEEKWLEVRNRLKVFHLKTIHVTHGGIDLRVLFFSLKR